MTLVIKVTEKPNPRECSDSDVFGNHYTDDPVQEAFSNNKVYKSLHTHFQTPKKKFSIPQTTNQDLGWFSNPLNRTNQRLNQHQVKNCEITKYAESYYSMTKTNPFQKGKR